MQIHLSFLLISRYVSLNLGFPKNVVIRGLLSPTSSFHRFVVMVCPAFVGGMISCKSQQNFLSLERRVHFLIVLFASLQLMVSWCSCRQAMWITTFLSLATPSSSSVWAVARESRPGKNPLSSSLIPMPSLAHLPTASEPLRPAPTKTSPQACLGTRLSLTLSRAWLHLQGHGAG